MCREKRGSSPIAAPRRGAAGAGGSTHRLAIPAGGPFLPRQPRGAGGAGGAGDWLQHCAVAVPRGGAGLSGLAFLALGAGIAKASAALGSRGKGIHLCPAARPLCPPPGHSFALRHCPAPPALLTLVPSSPFCPCRTETETGGCHTWAGGCEPAAEAAPSSSSVTHLLPLGAARPQDATGPRVPFQATLALLPFFSFGACGQRRGTWTLWVLTPLGTATLLCPSVTSCRHPQPLLRSGPLRLLWGAQTPS